MAYMILHLKFPSRPIHDNLLLEAQNGFHKATLAKAAFFRLLQVMETRKEYNRLTYICFTDFIKALGMVKRNFLWKVLLDKGHLPQHLIRAIQSPYKSTTVT